MTLTMTGSTPVTRTTNSNGEFLFEAVAGGSTFQVTPSKPGFVFHPVSQDVEGLNGDRQMFFSGSGFHFSAQNYDVNENAGSVTVTVVRTGGDQSVAATVQYQTEDDPAEVPCSQVGNTAYARCDYATTVGALTFEPGETSKVFSIPIIDDSYNENNETFTVRVKGTLTAPDTTTITIIDNDAQDGANPIFTTPFFVRLHYLDFLSREPEVGEPWTGVLNNCSDVNNDPTCDRLTVSAAFFGSPEFQLKGYFVYRFYKLAFNRLPTYAEISFDMAAVTGQTAAEVFARKAAFTDAFVLRQEFIDAFDALNNTQYVEALMGRYNLAQITTPDPANPDGDQKVTRNTAELITALDGATLTRAQVLRMIADSDQVFGLEFNQAFVAMQYFGYLRRAPEQAGFDAWLLYLNANPTDFRTMVNGFMNSIEYRLRFGPQ
ncbi:MAG TPA: Calx-beta domain-containing protein [Pyrinomonadaceae bacterium]|nr:Calx-beta domain-containing protein [Pyrinomonadaceae bacterium]